MSPSALGVVSSARVAPAGGGGGFLPSDLTGLVAWYDADDASSFTYFSGSSVRQWRDKSGANKHATVFGDVIGNAPTRVDAAINGKAGMNFYPTGAMETSRSGGVQPFHIFVVAKTPATTSNGTLIGGKGAGSISVDHNGEILRLLSMANHTAGSAATPFIINTPTVFGVSQTAGNVVSHYRNGIADGTSTDPNPWYSGSTVDLGANTAPNDGPFKGLVGEYLFYNRVLTDPERQQVEVYLNKKWLPAAGAILDSFNRADGLPGVTDTGQTWIVAAGAPVIASQQLSLPPPGTHEITVPTATQNLKITATYKAPLGNWASVHLWAPGNNYLAYPQDGVWTIHPGPGSTDVHPPGTPAIGQRVALAAYASGGVFKVEFWIDGVLKWSQDQALPSVNPANNRAGFSSYLQGGAWDDVRIEPWPPPDTLWLDYFYDYWSYQNASVGSGWASVRGLITPSIPVQYISSPTGAVSISGTTTFTNAFPTPELTIVAVYRNINSKGYGGDILTFDAGSGFQVSMYPLWYVSPYNNGAPKHDDPWGVVVNPVADAAFDRGQSELLGMSFNFSTSTARYAKPSISNNQSIVSKTQWGGTQPKDFKVVNGGQLPTDPDFGLLFIGIARTDLLASPTAWAAIRAGVSAMYGPLGTVIT